MLKLPTSQVNFLPATEMQWLWGTNEVLISKREMPYHYKRNFRLYIFDGAFVHTCAPLYNSKSGCSLLSSSKEVVL